METKFGFVYLIHCTGTPYYKIGYICRERGVIRRFQSMQCGCPFELKLVACKEVENPKRTERILHYQFYKKNVRGEWFELEAQDVESIISTLS